MKRFKIEQPIESNSLDMRENRETEIERWLVKIQSEVKRYDTKLFIRPEDPNCLYTLLISDQILDYNADGGFGGPPKQKGITMMDAVRTYF